VDLNGGKSSDKRKHHDETESYKDVKRVRTVYWFLSFFLPSFLFPFCLLSLVAAAVKAVKSRERLREEEQKKIKPKKTIITNNSSYNKSTEWQRQSVVSPFSSLNSLSLIEFSGPS